MNKQGRLAAFVGVLVLMLGTAHAADPANVDKLTTYATMLGRGMGCGIDVKDGSTKVLHWMDQAFPPGSEDQKTYLPVLFMGTKFAMEQQLAGKGPDTCKAVREALNGFPWP